MTLTQKQALLLFPIVMVGMMTFILTGLTGVINGTFSLSHWMHSWGSAYGIALPTMLLLSPPLKRVIARFTHE